MSLTALIIDDEPLARQELQYLLERAGGVEILAQGTNGIDAVELVRTHRPDVVFLDVQMPGLDGFAVLKKLLELKQPLPQIVFATAYNQYAVKAFEVNAADYLLKPFDRKRVLQTIDKLQRRRTALAALDSQDSQDSQEPAGLSQETGAKLSALLKLVEEQAQPARQQSGKVVVRAQNRLLLVAQREICFASIEDGTITVVTPAIEGHSNCRTLEELQEQLDPDDFWRVHRSYLVNIQHIREVVPWFKSSYQLRMDDPKKTEIPVSRAQTKRLRDLFNL
ncbi:MAG: LytTR family DNA-binding domain-containing protein [Acidobacteriaceae bacterium]|nr:LytTR family DNA-binding domain-containing protein [Acidobacteriaceae bacterium]